MTNTLWAHNLDVAGKVTGDQCAATMDEFERIAWESQLAICVVANPTWKGFVLVDLVESLPESTLDGFVARQLRFIGIFGICGVKTEIAFSPVMDLGSIHCVSASIIAHLFSGSAKPKAVGDINFMERLHQLRRRIEAKEN